MRQNMMWAEGDCQLSYLCSPSPGEIEPADRSVIFVHGTPGSASDWSGYLRPEQRPCRRLALDRPGFGHSGPDQPIVSLARQAGAVIALSDHERLARPVLVGHSLGAPIVLLAAALAPARFRAVVLVAGCFDPALEKVHALQRLGGRPGLRWLLPRFLRHANSELLALEEELTALSARLPELSLPVVVAHGTADRLVPYENVAFLQARLTAVPALELVRLEGHNHFLPWVAPETIRMAVDRAFTLSC